MSKLYLVDGSYQAFRAHFSLPPMNAADGTPTSALYGFTTMLGQMVNRHKPEYLVVSFDIGKTFRHEQYPAYKGHRPEMPPDLKAQWPLFPELVEAFGYRCISVEGFEADDVIGTLAKMHASDDLQVYIVSNDKDFGQLVNENIHMLDLKKGLDQGPAEIEEKLGVRPDQVKDLLGLTGDSSDNIPGVPGVGVKTAAKYLQKYDTIEAVLAAAESGEIKGKRGMSLVENAQQALMSRELATICLQTPVEESLEGLVERGLQVEKLRELFDRYNFGRVAARLLPKSEESPIQGQCVLNETDLKAVVEQIGEGDLFSFGLELSSTNASEAEVVGVRIGLDTLRAYYIPLRHDTDETMAAKLVWSHLRPLLTDETRKKVGHQLKLDYAALLKLGIPLRGVVGDTQLLHYLLFAHERSHDFNELCGKFLASSLLTHPEVKNGRRLRMDSVSLANACLVACEEATKVLALHEVLLPHLTEQSAELYSTIELPLAPVLAQMELNGVGVDLKRLESVRDEVTLQLSDSEQRCHDLAGRPFNVNSRHELREILFEELGLPPSKKVSDGWSTDHTVLEKLIDLNPLPRELLVHRRLSKLKGTYLDKLPGYVTEKGRIHTSMWQTVTVTGRLSSSDPNLQNIPIRTPEGRRIRECFVPARGHVFLSADYSQVELRVLAHLSREPTLISAFTAGEDIHCRTASEVFGVPVEWVTSDQRTAAKSINFGLLYGMSAFRLSRELSISMYEAKGYMEKYFERLPLVQSWVEETHRSVEEFGYVETMFGRRRKIPLIHSKRAQEKAAAQREAVNTRVQGTAADIIKIAMVRVDEALRSSDIKARMLLQVHDELLFEVPKRSVDALQDLVVESMSGAADIGIPLVVTVAKGANWAGAHG